MNRKRLLFTSIAIVLLSVVVAAFLGRAVYQASLSKLDWSQGDGPLIWNAVVVQLAYRPLIGCTTGAVLGLVARYTLPAVTSGKGRLTLAWLASIALVSLVLSAGWAAAELFLLDRFWP